MKHLGLTALLLLLFIIAMGQSQSNSWLRLSVETPLAPKLNGVAEWQYRTQGMENSGPVNRPLLYSFRPWLNYQLHAHTLIAVSPIAYYKIYPVILTEKDILKSPQQEWRTTIAVDQKVPLTPKLAMQSRTGLEYRNFSAQQDVIRARQKFGLEYQLSPQTRVLLYDEVMANLNAGALFEQNRLGAGVSIKLDEMMALETGYLYINRALPLINQHVIYVNIKLRTGKSRR
ncbi:DUF2490 domain-containing protein [Chitinophaga sp. Hz27]|uniref:DUF2490 domain-containing protein n=1 Tax=Chitinophaga sp. Hz27 TaxID=3347169 RepID=UPI0035DDF2B4